MEDFRRRARQRMPRMIFDALDGAAGTETASHLNIAELEALRLQPRVLVNVEHRELKTNFLGRQWDVPFGIAPMGMCNLFWPGADEALANVARTRNMPLGVSTMASTRIESMIDLAGGNAWFQLYAGESDEVTESLIDRARQANYETLVLTADVPVLAHRIRDLRNGFRVPFTMGPKQFTDFACHPRWALQTLHCGRPKPANVDWTSLQRRDTGRARIDWGFLSKLRSLWPNKLIIKGVMSPEDARMAVDAGSDAIYVSNHGGRQLDSAPSAIQMLPRIRQAVGPDTLLVFDSGVRSGEGVVKALVSGADFVMLGRPFLYALGASGPAGLQQMVDMLAKELSIVMAQLGCTRTTELDRTMLVLNDDLSPSVKFPGT
jgi:L-lactate dehydrogenase (cytochrome)